LSVLWFLRDLRLADHVALVEAADALSRYESLKSRN